MPVSPIQESHSSMQPEAIQSPNMQSSAERKNRVFDLTPQYNYQLAYRKNGWTVDSDGNLLPDLRNLSKRVSVNGVAKNGDFSPAKAKYESNGWIFIPHDVLGNVDYVAAYKTHKGQVTHRSIFETPYHVGPEQTKWRFDKVAYLKFINYLRKKGYIEDPRPEVIEPMLARLTKLKDSIPHPSKPHGLPRERYDHQVGQLDRQIESLQAELELSYEKFGRPQAKTAHSAIDDVMAMLDTELDEDVNKSKCPGCGRVFASPAGLKVHMKSCDKLDDGESE